MVLYWEWTTPSPQYSHCEENFCFCVLKMSSLYLYHETLSVCLPVLEKKHSVIFNHFHSYINTLTLSTSNYQFNWSYLWGVNQEDSVSKNKEHLKLYSYNLEKPLNITYHAFFKRAQERFLSHYQEYCSSSEQIASSWSTSHLMFNL